MEHNLDARQKNNVFNDSSHFADSRLIHLKVLLDF